MLAQKRQYHSTGASVRSNFPQTTAGAEENTIGDRH